MKAISASSYLKGGVGAELGKNKTGFVRFWTIHLKLRQPTYQNETLFEDFFPIITDIKIPRIILKIMGSPIYASLPKLKLAIFSPNVDQ